MRKLTFLLLTTTLMAGTTYAGGSLFKHKKSSNPYGVNAINVHICSELECPEVRIITGECDGEHMEMRYGVCLCEAGYVANEGVCEPCPEGQYSDGLTGCQACGDRTYKATPDATECTPCPDSFATSCDVNTGAATACMEGYIVNAGTCVADLTGTPCSDQADCGGTNSAYYCKITNYNTNDDSDENYYRDLTGTCQPVSNVPPVAPNASQLATLTAAGFSNTLVTSGTYMNWWSANNWCQAQGKRLMDVEELQCYRSGTTDLIETYEAGGCCCVGNNGTCEYSDWSSAETNGKFNARITALKSVYGNRGFWLQSGNNPNSFHAHTVAYGAINTDSIDTERWWDLDSAALCE